VATDLPLRLELSLSPFGPSDHTSFYVAGRPVMFFFTGVHGDYHRPSDTWDRINAAGLATVATVVARVISAAAAESTPPAYVKIDAPGGGGGVGGGYGPVFGIARVRRQQLARRRSPACTGRSRQKPESRRNVIVRSRASRESRGLTFVLKHRPGDEVQVVVLRDGLEQP
jgi:hypothetical protein